MNFVVFWPICQHIVDLQPLEETDVTFSAEKSWNTLKDFFYDSNVLLLIEILNVQSREKFVRGSKVGKLAR